MSELFPGLVLKANPLPKRGGKPKPPPVRITDKFAASFDKFEIDADLGAYGTRVAFDVESYPNYFCVCFRNIETGQRRYIECGTTTGVDVQEIYAIIARHVLVGFNSISYDIIMLSLAALGLNAAVLFRATQSLIVEGARLDDLCKEYGSNLRNFISKVDHIDLIEVAPLQCSLKLYSGRLHCQKMQELPFAVHTHLTAEQTEYVRHYCFNDVDNTATMMRELAEQVKLREVLTAEYGIDVRSKSDAQLAEAVIVAEVAKLMGTRPKKPNLDDIFATDFRYRVPDFISFQTPALKAMLEAVRGAVFTVNGSGAPVMPETLGDLLLPIGQGVYQMGMGGLHSTEKCAAHTADADTLLIDRDVASYYPKIILNQRLSPANMGAAFLTVYNGIVERRLDAKKRKDTVTADSLKITINGSFGKFGSMYSTLYAPDMMIQVTLTGQLSLLMLIEHLELVGIPVISANTDGFVTKCPRARYDEFNAIIKAWEQHTNFETEETQYAAIYSRDVNNYIAIKTDGTSKTKGAYSNPWESPKNAIFRFHKNPTTTVCIEAVYELLARKTPIEKTITECQDVKKFVSVKRVKGGGHKDGTYLGKAVRWYYSTETKTAIHYIDSGNQVGKTEGARPLMEMLGGLPSDIDYGWYVNEANEMLQDIGYSPKPVAQSLFA